MITMARVSGQVMQHPRHAAEPARAPNGVCAEQRVPRWLDQHAGSAATDTDAGSQQRPTRMQVPEFAVDAARLQAVRIISHDVSDVRSKSFDMLRTQVLQSMDAKRWQMLAVTSPTAGCGKTLSAINLALSIARQSERSVLLVDVDLQKPQIASRLGARCEVGLVSALEGHTALSHAVFEARVGDHRMLVLPAESATLGSSEWMASSAMHALLQDIRKTFPSRIVILDLPPMLLGDDVIAILPHVDCVLLVAAIGISTVPELEECKRHLRSTNVVRVVANKVPVSNKKYY